MDDILYSGFLEKQGKIPTLWSNKWCILKKDGFYWYSVKNESMPPEGMIELLNHCYVKADEENFHILTSNNLGKGGFTFITPNKKYHFKTTNEMERVQWFSALQEVGCIQQGIPPPTSDFIASKHINKQSSSPQLLSKSLNLQMTKQDVNETMKPQRSSSEKSLLSEQSTKMKISPPSIPAKPQKLVSDFKRLSPSSDPNPFSKSPPKVTLPPKPPKPSLK